MLAGLGDAFEPSTDPAGLARCDAVIICVPTPLGQHREPDLSYVVGSTQLVAKTLRQGQLVVLVSTTYPGTTEEVVAALESNHVTLHEPIQFRVNGKMVPLRSRLSNGDTVEVVTSPSQYPRKDWLEFVVSSKARNRIRHAIREGERVQAPGTVDAIKAAPRIHPVFIRPSFIFLWRFLKH